MRILVTGSDGPGGVNGGTAGPQEVSRTLETAGRRPPERAFPTPTLEEALRYELGIMGGSGGPGEPSLAYQGAGLKIWASWDGINMVQDKPLFAGRATIAMAREVYGIRDPSDRQASLF